MSEEKREIRIHPYNSIGSIIVPNFGSRDPWTTNEKEIASYSRNGNTVRVISPHDPLLRLEQNPLIEGVGLYDRGTAFGAEEIITLDKFSPEGLELLLEITSSRMKGLQNAQFDGKRPRQFHTYFTYEEDGLVGRLFASERIAPSIDAEIKKALSHYEFRRRCMYCDIVRQEQKTSINEESRIVFFDKDNGYIGFIPFSPQNPYQLSIFPINHITRLTEFSPDKIQPLAAWIYMSMAVIREQTHKKINLFLYSTPFFSDKGEELKRGIEKSHHFHVEIIPEGVQIPGTGWYIVDLRPKDAARILREYLKYKFSDNQPNPLFPIQSFH